MHSFPSSTNHNPLFQPRPVVSQPKFSNSPLHSKPCLWASLSICSFHVACSTGKSIVIVCAHLHYTTVSINSRIYFVNICQLIRTRYYCWMKLGINPIFWYRIPFSYYFNGTFLIKHTSKSCHSNSLVMMRRWSSYAGILMKEIQPNITNSYLIIVDWSSNNRQNRTPIHPNDAISIGWPKIRQVYWPWLPAITKTKHPKHTCSRISITKYV